MPAPDSLDWLKVGRVVGAQGLKGELKINPSSDFPERFTQPGPRWLQASNGGSPKKMELIRGRQLPGRSLFVVRLEGINDRAAAETLVGQDFLVHSDDRPTLQEGEFHLLDLVGLEVRLNAEGSSLGTVQDLISAGNDLLEIQRPDGRTLLVPFVEAIVPEVHLDEGWLLVTPPPGLLEL
ncbi:ribosome maturation factor RimM [Synechococcus sp. MIT S1220]|uniref:ribosome maturation factor RimM n=1 Tax=Synechococcus sp. MIT S1220 TaxID=3082549 RepID=UPI0039AFB559